MQHFLRRLDKGSKDGVGNIDDNETDRAGRLGTHALGDGIWLVMELIYSHKYALLSLEGHMLVTVQDTRDGPQRDASGLGNLAYATFFSHALTSLTRPVEHSGRSSIA